MDILGLYYEVFYLGLLVRSTLQFEIRHTYLRLPDDQHMKVGGPEQLHIPC